MLRHPVAAISCLAVIAWAAACSRRALTNDAGGIGQLGHDGGLDGAAGAGADAVATDVRYDANADLASADGGEAIPCGPGACTGTDLCVETLGCGGPLSCMDATDAGACPPGTQFDQRCRSATGREGCVPDCPPPVFVCVPRPATCTGTLDCSCLGSSFCAFGSCLGVQGRLAECGNV
jgi:hypothetical protein